MKKSFEDWKAIQEKAEEKYERTGPSAVYEYGKLLGLNLSDCNECNAITHDVGDSDGTVECLLCGSRKLHGPVHEKSETQEYRSVRGTMVVERVNGIIFEITPGALEDKDCNGIRNGFNLCAVFREHDESTCTVYGSINDAWGDVFTNVAKGVARIHAVSEHELINLQRMAEEAFTFEELINNWNNV